MFGDEEVGMLVLAVACLALVEKKEAVLAPCPEAEVFAGARGEAGVATIKGSRSTVGVGFVVGVDADAVVVDVADVVGLASGGEARAESVVRVASVVHSRARDFGGGGGGGSGGLGGEGQGKVGQRRRLGNIDGDGDVGRDDGGGSGDGPEVGCGTSEVVDRLGGNWHRRGVDGHGVCVGQCAGAINLLKIAQGSKAALLGRGRRRHCTYVRVAEEVALGWGVPVDGISDSLKALGGDDDGSGRGRRSTRHRVSFHIGHGDGVGLDRVRGAGGGEGT